jgi:hypothetical protein
MEGYRPLIDFRYSDTDYSSRVRDYPEEKRFIEFLRDRFASDLSGTTLERPTVEATGYRYFDVTLGKPIWWNGTHWVDATGTSV